MIIHTVAFQWKSGATPDIQQEALEQLTALKAEIPEVQEAYVGPNTAPHAGGYVLAATMIFASQAALNAYLAHPAHQALVGWLGAWVDLVEIDIAA